MKFDQMRYVNLINFITKHWLIETQKSRSSVRFVLRSSMLSSSDLCTHWSVLIHLYDDDTIQVSILYGCSLLIDDDTFLDQAIYGVVYMWRCGSRDPHQSYSVRLPSIYLIGKTFWSDNNKTKCFIFSVCSFFVFSSDYSSVENFSESE
jgi:hypothetical protein